MRLVNYGKASSKIPSSEVRCPVAFAAGLLLGLILAAGALLMGRHLPPLAPDADDIYVSLGAYRDKECAQTLVNLFRQTAAAAAPEAAVAGAVEAEPDLDEIPPTQLTPPQPGVNPVELACARAVADFWSRLMQFAQLGVPQNGLRWC
ncbi:hypothetical protein CHLRE_17g733026v5 [Chlamydomonas reinhardtii]|uniref:Uncharacterized protein n=1 Tax=Chlamydomonas reinhardtii TaxID=3055 RepID=A0A2K3CR42_CHLRE|nr:uncharacterized protein CHLRE_17g733026v5 [Chlamydomonas reinhardtii]PNW70750.1 hypothetical protein CHLRE_17g733026v5 [Chlamydomonas reinhardtii]